MTSYNKKFKYLQRISQVKLEAAQRARMEREVFYPPERIEISGEISTTINGEAHTVSLIYKGRADSFYIAFDGYRLYYNRYGSLVFNVTRWPLILGLSDAHRFLGKQIIRRRYEKEA
jgi:hypothetical protein